MANLCPDTTMPPSLFQGVDKSSISYRMLSSMGWKEGEGLVSATFVIAVASVVSSPLPPSRRREPKNRALLNT